jgi:hypothetical protein
MSDLELEGRIERALRAPLPDDVQAKRAIMNGVRRIPRDERPRRRLALPQFRVRHSLIGLAMAAGVGSITTLSALVPSAGVRATGAVTSAIIGDSVADRLRDTMRLVRLMFDDPAARQVSIVGDFNGWKKDATSMQRDERTGRWGVTLALHDGEHRYAIVADGTRQVSSVLRVARTSN